MDGPEPLSRAGVLQGLVEIVEKSEGRARLQALTLLNKELGIFASKGAASLSPSEISELLNAAEKYIVNPANWVGPFKS